MKQPPKFVKTHGQLQTAPAEPADAYAIQALFNGNADSEQQRRAMKWIMEFACGIHDISFVPGEDGRRQTDFNEGRRFVAKQIAELLRTNVTQLIDALRRKENV